MADGEADLFGAEGVETLHRVRLVVVRYVLDGGEIGFRFLPGPNLIDAAQQITFTDSPHSPARAAVALRGVESVRRSGHSVRTLDLFD